ILKLRRAQVAHGLGLGQSERHQGFGGRFSELNFQAVILVETLGKLVHQFPADDSFFLFLLDQQGTQRGGQMLDQVSRNHKAPHVAGGNSNFKSRKTRSHAVIKPRAPVCSSPANSAMRRKPSSWKSTSM